MCSSESSSQASLHKMGYFQKGIFLALCSLLLIHEIVALSVAVPEVSAYFFNSTSCTPDSNPR